MHTQFCVIANLVFHISYILILISVTIFYKKLRIWASTESFLKLSDFEYKVSLQFLKGSKTIFKFTNCALVFKAMLLENFPSNMIQETSEK